VIDLFIRLSIHSFTSFMSGIPDHSLQSLIASSDTV